MAKNTSRISAHSPLCLRHLPKAFTPLLLIAIILLPLLFAANIFLGSISIPAAKVAKTLIDAINGIDISPTDTIAYIILQSRVPQAVVATLCGASLAVSGLLLQTAFRNPLAGPSIFGITSGASLAVAVVSLLLGGSISALGMQLTVFAAALIGAAAVTAIILALSTVVRQNVMLLIVGIMIGYIASSAITLLNYFASAEGIRSYMLWGMGSFGDVSLEELPLFAILSISGIVASLLLIKPLNTMLLGDRYAENLGINIRRVRFQLLLTTGLLTAVATAYCGPVAFIGLAVPHIARLLTKTENHHTLLPATIVCGAAVALLCNIISTLPTDGTLLPINAITPLVGAPIIIYVIMKRR